MLELQKFLKLCGYVSNCYLLSQVDKGEQVNPYQSSGQQTCNPMRVRSYTNRTQSKPKEERMKKIFKI